MIIPLHQRRALTNYAALTISMIAMVFGLFWVIWILAATLEYGFANLSLNLILNVTPAPGVAAGGLANAIIGSLIIVFLATAIGAPIGIMAGIYLAEYGTHTWLGRITRFINDLLLSAPSIIIGLFIYEIYVVRVGHFSAFAGIMALSLIVIPVVIRTTENILRLVPNSLREAAFALGAPQWRVITQITLKASLAGVTTGILLAVARISGETAPLLFTVLSNQFWSVNLNAPMATLPVTIFKFAMSPFADWQALAWGGIFLITFGVLILNVMARSLFKRKFYG